MVYGCPEEDARTKRIIGLMFRDLNYLRFNCCRRVRDSKNGRGQVHNSKDHRIKWMSKCVKWKSSTGSHPLLTLIYRIYLIISPALK